MSSRPKGDLSGLMVSKAAAAEAVPFGVAQEARGRGGETLQPTVLGVQRSLTVKLEPAVYARLRHYCYTREQALGRKLTHQDVMVRALDELLAREGA